MRGEWFILAAQVFWAVGALYLKKLLSITNPLLAHALVAVFGGILLLPVIGLYWNEIVKNPPQQWWFAAIRGIAWIAVGGLLFTIGLSKTTLSNTSILALTYPLFATILAVVLLHETLSVRFTIASLLFLAGY